MSAKMEAETFKILNSGGILGFPKAKPDRTRILCSLFPNSSCAVDVSSKVANDLVSLKVATVIVLCHS